MEYTLVTVLVKNESWSADMELPVKLKIRDLSVKMLDALKKYNERLFEDVDSIKLEANGRRLNENASLYDYGLWDGSIIEVIL